MMRYALHSYWFAAVPYNWGGISVVDVVNVIPYISKAIIYTKDKSMKYLLLQLFKFNYKIVIII